MTFISKRLSSRTECKQMLCVNHLYNSNYNYNILKYIRPTAVTLMRNIRKKYYLTYIPIPISSFIKKLFELSKLDWSIIIRSLIFFSDIRFTKRPCIAEL